MYAKRMNTETVPVHRPVEYIGELEVFALTVLKSDLDLVPVRKAS